MIARITDVSKEKAHKCYEYSRKASVLSTLDGQVVVGVESHDQPVHDCKILSDALAVAY